MEMTDTVFDAANRRGEDMKATFPAAVAVRYDRRISRVVISLASGLQIAFAPRDAQGLENAHPADLVDAEISPSGLGVHFPKLDADLYILPCLKGFWGPSAGWRHKWESAEGKLHRMRRPLRLGRMASAVVGPENTAGWSQHDKHHWFL